MPNYGLSKTWADGESYKKPFNYVLGVGRVESDEEADKHEAEGKQVVLCHRLDMGDLLKLGIAEELDFMSKELVTSDTPSEKPAEAINQAILKADNFKNMERMINLVVTAGVDQPRLHMPPVGDDLPRQKGLIYADSIPFMDRMELFSELFDSEGLSTFREKQEVGVGNVEHVESVQLPPDGSVAELQPEHAEGVLSQ